MIESCRYWHSTIDMSNGNAIKLNMGEGQNSNTYYQCVHLHEKGVNEERENTRREDTHFRMIKGFGVAVIFKGGNEILT